MNKNDHNEIQGKMITYIINDRNAVDEYGKPVGHAVKAMYELKKMLCNDYCVVYMASKELCHALDGKSIALPYKQVYSEKRNLKQEFICDFLNYRIGIRKTEVNSILWHVIMSEAIFWAIAFTPKKRRKLVVTVYQDYELYFDTVNTLKRFRNWIFRRACKKIDLCVVTNSHFHMPTSTVFIPDYNISDEDRVLSAVEKCNRVVCLGQMRESRDLDGLVSAFSNSDMQLYIIGQFADLKWYEKLTSMASPNIHIENKLVENDEYRKILSESRYSILPYNMSIYKGRTSGVLLESLFLGAIPIAPQELLDYNGVNGIGYKKIEDVPSLIKSISKIESNDMDIYDFENGKKKLLEAIMNVRE